MRKILAVLLLLTGLAGATTVTVTGTVTGPDGNPLPSGTVVFTLPFSAKDTSTGRFVTSLPQITFTIANGAPQPGGTLIPNDVLSPSGYYVEQFFDASGNMYGMANVVIPTGGGTFDIGAATPTSVLTSNISYITPASLSGNQTWTGSNTFALPIISTVATGTPPFIVASTSKVVGLWVAGLISDTVNPAAGGTIRLANLDQICWRGFTNAYDDCIGLPNSSDNPYFRQGAGAVQTLARNWSRDVFSNQNVLVNTSNTENIAVVLPPLARAGGNIYFNTTPSMWNFHADGILTNTSGGAATYTIRVRIENAGAILCQSAAVSVATGVSNAPWSIDCTLSNYTIGVAGTASAYGTYFVNATTGSSVQAALLTYDTTVTHAPVVTMQMSVSNVNTSFTTRVSYVDHIGF